MILQAGLLFKLPDSSPARGLDTVHTRTDIESVCAHGLQAKRPRTALKLPVSSRATAVRLKEELAQEVDVLSQQYEVDLALVESLVSSYNALVDHVNDQQKDIAPLEHQLEQAQISRDEVFNLTRKTCSALHMERATSAGFMNHIQQLQFQLLPGNNQTISADALKITNLQKTVDELIPDRDRLQQATVNVFGLHVQIGDLTSKNATLAQEKTFAEEDAARCERHCKEAEEEANVHLQKLNELQKQSNSDSRNRREAVKAIRGKQKAADGSDAEFDVLSAPELLIEERARYEARLDSYRFHVQDLESQLAAAYQRIRGLDDDASKGDEDGELIWDWDDDSHASHPKSLRDAQQCIHHLQRRVQAEERRNAPLAGWVADLEQALAVSEAKRKLGSAHIQLLQECEPVSVSANCEIEQRTYKQRARTSICQHAQQAIAMNREKQELLEQKDSAYKTLEAQHEELKYYNDRTLNDFIASEQEKADLVVRVNHLTDANRRLANDNQTLNAFLNHRVFGLKGSPAAAKLAKYEHEIRELERGVDRRDDRIRELVSDLGCYTQRHEKFGRGGVVQGLEETIADLKISKLRCEAIVKAFEMRFEREVTRRKLEVDLGPAETEFTTEQEVQKEQLRRLDRRFYTVKDGEIVEDEEDDWCF